jgi:uncharacterized membrane protein
MGKGRLEAFSDGVIAVIITIMVLEMKAPHGAELSDLMSLLPTFLTYVLSFVFVGIYWVNHHHFFQVIKRVSGTMLWANNHLLFATWPVAVYGINLLACAVAYTIMTIVAVREHGPDSEIAHAVGRDKKGKISLLLYIVSVPMALFAPMISCALFVAVSLIWLVPDRRIESVIK